mgnify:CR=1 FL=1
MADPQFAPHFDPMHNVTREILEPGILKEVAPGVHWLRMPLPFQLNDINLWVLEDGDGWTLIDTGINREETITAWKTLFQAPWPDGRLSG